MNNQIKTCTNNIAELLKNLMTVKTDVVKSTQVRMDIKAESDKAVDIIIENFSKFKWRNNYMNSISAILDDELKIILKSLYTHEEANMAKTCNISRKLDSMTTLYIFGNDKVSFISINVVSFIPEDESPHLNNIIKQYKLEVI